jgi:hypothetical protein
MTNALPFVIGAATNRAVAMAEVMKFVRGEAVDAQAGELVHQVDGGLLGVVGQEDDGVSLSRRRSTNSWAPGTACRPR